MSAGAGGRGGGSAGPGGQAQTAGSPQFSHAGGRAGPGRAWHPFLFPPLSACSARRGAPRAGPRRAPVPQGQAGAAGGGRTLHLLGVGARPGSVRPAQGPYLGTAASVPAAGSAGRPGFMPAAGAALPALELCIYFWMATFKRKNIDIETYTDNKGNVGPTV